MGYCAASDITAIISNSDLIQLTNSSGGDTVVTSVITAAIDFADNMIDGYLRGRYTLPLTSTPDELKYIEVELVVYRLYSLRAFAPVPENINERQKDAMKKLYDIQRGQFSLGIEDTDEPSGKLMRTNKTATGVNTNKYYNKDKWDDNASWEDYD